MLLQLSTLAGLRLSADNGPFGSITIAIHPHCDGVMSVECNRQAPSKTSIDGITENPSNCNNNNNSMDDHDNMSTHSAAAKTRLSTTHLAVACGAKLLTSNAFISAGALARARGINVGNVNLINNPHVPHADPFLNYQAQLLNTANMLAGALSGAGSGNPLASLFSGFEKVTLQINAQRQLSITHVQQENDIKVSVAIVVQPLYSLEN